MSEQSSSAPDAPVAVESPPPSPRTEADPAGEARTRLHALAAELTRTHNRRMLIEFLQLRRRLGAGN